MVFVRSVELWHGESCGDSEQMDAGGVRGSYSVSESLETGSWDSPKIVARSCGSN